LSKIKFNIHPLFWLLVFLSVLTGYFIETITLFVIVFIHEMGHITAASIYSWRLNSLQILPFGGVAEIDEWGTVLAKEEIIVALAGPFQHLLIILLSVLFFKFNIWNKDWTIYFITSNLIIGVFNLLPIYPLDGGRVFQCLLFFFFPFKKCMYFIVFFSLFSSLMLLCSSFFLPGTFVHLPLLIISLFLLCYNFRVLKNINIQFLRFLLHRASFGVSLPYKLVSLRVKKTEKILDVLKKFYKEKYHVIEVVNEQNQLLNLLPEEVLLKGYFLKNKVFIFDLVF